MLTSAGSEFNFVSVEFNSKKLKFNSTEPEFNSTVSQKMRLIVIFSAKPYARCAEFLYLCTRFFFMHNKPMNRTYTAPAMKVVEIQFQQHLLSGSDFSNGINTMTLDDDVDGDNAFD